MGSLGFFIDMILSATLWPGVNSASNRNEYQEYFLGGKDGQYLGLTTLPPSCASCHEIWEFQSLKISGPVQVHYFYCCILRFVILGS